MTNKEKKLLVYVGAIAIVAIAYFFIISPTLEKIETASTNVLALTAEVQRLQAIYDSRDEYEKNIKEYKQDIDDLIERFPNKITEEDTLVFVDKIEAGIPMSVTAVGFNEETVVFGSVSAEAQVVEGAEAAGTAGSDEILDLSGLTGIKENTNLNYSASYDDFKKFIHFLNHYKSRMVITSINANYSNDSGLVSGSMVLSQYGIDQIGAEREKNDFEDIPESTANIFYAGTAGDVMEDESDEVDTNPNLFINVGEVNDNVSAIVAGVVSDTSGDSQLNYNQNETASIDVTVENGEEDNYNVTFEIGDESKTGSFKAEGDNLVLRISSSDRSSAEDNVDLSVNLTNKSDKRLVINVESDLEAGRVNIASRKGDISVND